jgi:hypothetical protein
MDDFYLILSSKEDLLLYPDNTPSNFKCRLPLIELELENWVVGVVDFLSPKPSIDYAFLCSGIVQSSYKSRKKINVMSIVKKSSDVFKLSSNIIYHNLSNENLNEISITIKDLQMTDVVFSDKNSPTILLLHFKKT